MTSLAWFAVFLYPVGIECFCAALLFKASTAIIAGKETPLTKSIAFLHQEYQVTPPTLPSTLALPLPSPSPSPSPLTLTLTLTPHPHPHPPLNLFNPDPGLTLASTLPALALALTLALTLALALALLLRPFAPRPQSTTFGGAGRDAAQAPASRPLCQPRAGQHPPDCHRHDCLRCSLAGTAGGPPVQETDGRLPRAGLEPADAVHLLPDLQVHALTASEALQEKMSLEQRRSTLCRSSCSQSSSSSPSSARSSLQAQSSSCRSSSSSGAQEAAPPQVRFDQGG